MSISLLPLLLFILVTPLIIDYYIFPTNSFNLHYAVLFFLLFSMFCLDIFFQKLKHIFAIRSFIVWAIIFLSIGVGCVVGVVDRYKISAAYQTHDIIIQQEVATRMLLTGKNPYKETYFGTALEEFNFSKTEVNPALYHFVMEPFYLLSVIPFYFIESRLFGFFDARIPLYILFFLLLFAGYKIVKKREDKLLFLTLMAFNPMMLRYTMEGRSDMFMYPFLFGAFIFLQKERFSFATVFTAIAFTIKQTAWPFLPLYFYFLWLKKRSLQFIFTNIAVFIAICTVIIGPFFVWDPQAFLSSTVFYLTGTTKHSYPVSGYGFGAVLKDLGIIKDVYAYYPFIIWQTIFGIPLLVILFRLLKKHSSTRVLILGYGIFLFVFWYFSRYFNNSHIGFISAVLITAYFWPDDRKTKS